ncbi:MAG: RNA polymerase sigma factor [Proteobacteria bacterium]|nr:RNA polymerase sigma factor [Pseudomonadota bacterium]
MAHQPAASVSYEHAQRTKPGAVMLREEADEALMIHYQKGDVRAFEILLERHRKPIYNFIFRFVGSRDVAEDLLQETFLRVIKGAANYQRKAKFTTWLYTIARNLCVDQSRRKKHRKAASLDQPMTKSEDSGTLMDVIPGKEMPSDRKAVSRQLHQTIHRALAALPGEQREVFLMREFLNMPFKQIAEIVGIPENTVKSRMRYALEKLRLELEEYKDMAKALP